MENGLQYSVTLCIHTIAHTTNIKLRSLSVITGKQEIYQNVMKYAELKNKGRKPPVKNDKQAERVSEEVHLNFQGVVPYLKSERKDCDPPLKQKISVYACFPVFSPSVLSQSPHPTNI